MNVKHAWRFFCSFVLLLILPAIVLAQAGNGGINGVVTDPSGAAVPGTTVTVQSKATGVILSRTSNGTGVYSFTSLPPAAYQVTFSREGFETSVHDNVVVTVDQTTIVNGSLKIGSANQTITITESSSLMETSNSTVGQLIDEQTIDRVPLLTRDVYQLVQLSSGVNATNGVPNASDTTAVFNARPGADVTAYTINGAMPGSVQFLVDGSPIGVAENNLGALIPAMQMPLDSIQEYRVETQNTPATYQSGGAGAISLVTKSGGNRFHGSAFVYLRPDVMAANDYFLKQNELEGGLANQPLSFHRYQEGGSIGGRILRDKLFFFADYEATQQDTVQTGYFTVPTDAERTGDFSAATYTIYNPLVPDQPNGTRQPFSDQGVPNVIPQADLDPIALKYAQQYPKANRAGVGPYHLNNYFGSGLDPNNAQKFDIRIDGYRGQKQHIFGRFSFARLLWGSADLYGANNIYDPLYYQTVTNARNFLLADDITLGKNTLLQLRYSFTRHYENQTGDPRQTGFDMTSLGFPGSLAAEQVYKDIPMMWLGNTASLGSYPWVTFQYASENPYDVIASVTTVKGKHSIGAGVEIEKLLMNEGQPVAPSGMYQFDDTATSSTTWAGDGSDFASFLIGMGSAPGDEWDNFTKDLFVAESSPYYALYVQDSYKPTSKLTIGFGLRWDVFGGRTERHDRLEYFDPNVQYTVNGVALKGGEQFVGNHRSRSPFDSNLSNFGPRLSFAWQPKGHLVFRGGSAIYYGPSIQMVANGALNSDGYGPISTWLATSWNENGNSVMQNPLSNPFPNGVQQEIGSSQGPATNLGNALTTELRSQRTTTTYDFNLGVENQFAHGIVLAVAYVGSRGRFLPLTVDLNQLSLQTIGQYQSSLTDQVSNPLEAVYPISSAFYGQATVPRYMTLEPYPQFTCGNINCGVGVNGYPGGNSNYDSMQMKVEKRLSSHFTTLATFTWAKLMSNFSGGPLSFVGNHAGVVQDWRNPEFEHSVSPQDVNHSFTWQMSYDLPFGAGRAVNFTGWKNEAFGGWTANTIVYLNGGVPVAVPSAAGNPIFSQRVDMTCNPAKAARHRVDQWFNYTCFAQPGSHFAAGNSPRMLSSVRTDGANDLDMSIYKSFHLGENRALRLEVSSYNVTNSVQFGNPSVFWKANPTAENMAGFGQITTDVNTPRQFQFASRFTF